ncbi:uncharacterized protein N7459_007823 [Penicillium hispanicum]|uniref:uncharacterized protein n=1 Tax=Penicillium hispanicum TaxID=1080232 RepID=UPI0025419CE4|nr:uncharacterized protein N7459_007823 [Penicillium hispanicum]KAJ5573396.1 hypothetical protein N7459_007823 [Penicillium hispanicum]
MEHLVNSSDCLRPRSARLPLSSRSNSRLSARLHRAPSRRPGRTSLLSQPIYHGLLILILIISLLPRSTLAQPTSAVSDPSAHIPPAVSTPSREIIVDDLFQTTRRDDGVDNVGGNLAETTKTDMSPLKRQIATVNGSSNSSMEMPAPFDTLSNSFANSTCVNFFQKFLSNSTVTNCHAVSLLLQNSNSFFHMLTSATETSHVLDTACSESVSSCSSIMDSVASEMLEEANCGPDYQANNSVVTGAYAGLMAYEPTYHATCLTNPDTKDYCFVDAVQNATAPNDYDVYFMPLGNPLGSGELTCNECLQATMGVFAHWATINDQALDTTYLPSAKQVNTECGSNFANVNVTVGSNNVQTGAGVTVTLPDTRFAVSLFGLALGATMLGAF